MQKVWCSFLWWDPSCFSRDLPVFQVRDGDKNLSSWSWVPPSWSSLFPWTLHMRWWCGYLPYADVSISARFPQLASWSSDSWSIFPYVLPCIFPVTLFLCAFPLLVWTSFPYRCYQVYYDAWKVDFPLLGCFYHSSWGVQFHWLVSWYHHLSVLLSPTSGSAIVSMTVPSSSPSSSSHTLSVTHLPALFPSWFATRCPSCQWSWVCWVSLLFFWTLSVLNRERSAIWIECHEICCFRCCSYVILSCCRGCPSILALDASASFITYFICAE